MAMETERGLIVQDAIPIPVEEGLLMSETQELRQQISRQIQTAKLQGEDDIHALGESYYNLVIKYMTEFIERSRTNPRMANFKKFSISFRQRETGMTEMFIEEEYKDGTKEFRIEYLSDLKFECEAFDYLCHCIHSETGFTMISDIKNGLYTKTLVVVPE